MSVSASLPSAAPGSAIAPAGGLSVMVATSISSAARTWPLVTNLAARTMATWRGVDCAIGGAGGASSALLSRFSAYAVTTTSPSAPTAKKILCFSGAFKIRGSIFVKARYRLILKYSCQDKNQQKKEQQN